MNILNRWTILAQNETFVLQWNLSNQDLHIKETSIKDTYFGPILIIIYFSVSFDLHNKETSILKNSPTMCPL